MWFILLMNSKHTKILFAGATVHGSDETDWTFLGESPMLLAISAMQQHQTRGLIPF
jgi:hypothetical protein